MAKILVVDDSESQRTQLKADLESGSHSVIEASDGHDGLEKLEKNSDIGLIICDVNMPGMDGLTMCSKIKQSGKHLDIPIFMLTSEATIELKKTAKEYGVRAWITKPYVAAKLLEALSKVIKK